MTDPVRTATEKLLANTVLTEDDMYAAMQSVMTGGSGEVQLAALLTALHIRGESAEAIAGSARAMSEQATHLQPARTGLLDTCGTGGSGIPAFNISTAAAFVAAAAGVPVAKHGNRAATSRSGSADVLEELGVDITCTPAVVEKCIDTVGIGFLFARSLHAAMKYAAPVRQALGFRTIFNLLGPLTNPAGAAFQLLGCSRDRTARTLAESLAMLGRERAFVVCGGNQFDELCLWADNLVCIVEGDEVREELWSPTDFGLPPCDPAEILVDSPAESADLIRRVFAGEHGAARNMIVANAAAALLLTKRVATLRAGVEKAADQIDSGAAAEKLKELIGASQA